jgi:putative transposase
LPLLLDIAGLARSTFFYHQAKPEVPDPLAGLKAAIRKAFEDARGRYGHRRVHAVLTGQGFRVAKKTVLTLMRELALICRVRRRRRYNAFHGEVGQIADNVLDRDFTATAPNQKWVTDVTEFRVADRKVYLSPVIDLFDRSVVAHSWSLSPNLELTNTSLSSAIATLAPGQHPLVHSDQGFQYQHRSWRALLADAEATQSMSRKGNCYDNAMAENFFGHLIRDVPPQPIRHRRNLHHRTRRIRPLVQHRTNLDHPQGPEPGPIPSPDPCGLSSKSQSPTSGDHFNRVD